MGVDGVGHNGINLAILSAKDTDHVVALSYRFALEWAPHDSTVANRELSQAAPGQDATLRDVESVHDCDDEVVSRACAFDVLQKLGGDKLVHVAAEVGRVQRHMTREIVEKEHVGPVSCRCRSSLT